MRSLIAVDRRQPRVFYALVCVALASPSLAGEWGNNAVQLHEWMSCEIRISDSEKKLNSV
jgi:hypothetical protein